MLSSYVYSNKTESAAVKTGPGGVHTVTLTSGSDAATLILYDNTAGSGTIIVKLACTAANTTASVTLNASFSTGCFAALTGTTPSATVTYW